MDSMLNSFWDIKTTPVYEHSNQSVTLSRECTHNDTSARWVIMHSARPCNVTLMVVFISCHLLRDTPFQREPGLIGQALRGGGLDTLQPGSISQLLQMLVANNSGVLSVRSRRMIMLRRACFLHVKMEWQKKHVVSLLRQIVYLWAETIIV